MISSIFVGLLVALAFTEMIEPIRHELRSKNGDLLGTACLLVIFFTTGLRFFIGNQLHLISKELAALPGRIWLTDFCLIVIQCTVLVFMGGVCSIEETRLARANLIQLQMLVLALDIFWVVFIQYILGKLLHSWYRPNMCFEWVYINSALLAATFLVHGLFQSWSAHPLLIMLMVLNVVAFLMDVYYCDKYDLI